MGVSLYSHQIEAVEKMHNGSILCGGVGTGKSRTALAYYIQKVCGGKFAINGEGRREPMRAPRDLFIITTAKKRDSREWLLECSAFLLEKENVRITVDSWNNIKKYRGIYECFFIFDEQRVVGSGAWVKAFLDITRKNQWVLLSATPGDTWTDYIPVFVANGFYENKTQFLREHAVYNRYSKYPKIDQFVGTAKLNRYRRQIIVDMKFERSTTPNNTVINCDYDKDLYRSIIRERWNYYDHEPIEETGKLFYLMRRVVNSDSSRIEEVKKIALEKKKVIIFYNFTYELESLRDAFDDIGIKHAEWNGEKHEEIPEGDSWAYLVQYIAGAEGWNCIKTDTIIFFSQSYSYRQTLQASGRIDRMNTPYKNLYYYYLRSYAPIDLAIAKALKNKKDFNEKAFLRSNSLA